MPVLDKEAVRGIVQRLLKTPTDRRSEVGLATGNTTQESSFSRVQELFGEHKSEEWITYTRAVLVLAAQRGLHGLTAEEVTGQFLPQTFSPNLTGAVFGSLRSKGIIQVVSREKSKHSEAKGRWVNRFVLTVALLAMHHPTTNGEP